MDVQVDGKRAYVYTAGQRVDAERPTVMFVHGAGGDHSGWILQSRYFAYHDRNALALDLPGHGRSAGPVLTDIGAQADWVCRLLSVLGLEQAAIVGHSMGSLIALDAAERYPQRITRIAMLGTSVPMVVGASLMEAARANQHAAFDMINLWGHSYRAQLGGNAVPGMWLTGGALRILERSEPDVLYTDLNACNASLEGLDKAANVRCPVLLLLGREDMMARPRGALALASVLADARTTVLDGCGHMLMGECPDAVLDALIGFL